MKRWQRVLVEILAPPALGAGLWLLIIMAGYIWRQGWAGWSLQNWLEGLELALIVTIYACFFAGLPSLFYTAIMEWSFAHGLDPAGWKSVALSSLLGYGSGLGIIAVLSGRWWDPASGSIFGSIGLTVGFLIGMTIRWSARRKRHAPVAGPTG